MLHWLVGGGGRKEGGSGLGVGWECQRKVPLYTILPPEPSLTPLFPKLLVRTQQWVGVGVSFFILKTAFWVLTTFWQLIYLEKKIQNIWYLSYFPDINIDFFPN